jgi:hypothetical protein
MENVAGQKQNDSIKTKPFKHGLGVAAGFSTGYGLSYRLFPNKFGIQLAFAPYMDDYESYYSFGFTFLYKIIETEFTNLFVYQGNHFYYSKYKSFDYTYMYPNYTFNQVEIVNKNWNNGIGLGIEFTILKRVSLNLMGGYAAYKNFKNIGFTGETALFFKF